MKQVRTRIGGLGNLMFKEAYILGKMLDGDIPDVYVQGEKYWKKHADVIKSYFSEDIGVKNAVSLHIRRGDYLKTDFYIDLWKTDYYHKALELFPTEKFIVFCRDNQGWDQDKADRQWCRDNLEPLLGDRFELAPKENTEIDDFNLMASCKSVIGANSSFSWWAAYLGKHEEIVMPAADKWFKDGVMRIELLSEWTIL